MTRTIKNQVMTGKKKTMKKNGIRSKKKKILNYKKQFRYFHRNHDYYYVQFNS